MFAPLFICDTLHDPLNMLLLFFLERWSQDLLQSLFWWLELKLILQLHCLSVSGQECQVKAEDVNGKKRVRNSPAHTCVTAHASYLCVHLNVYVHIVYVLCLWVNPSPLAPWHLCQADRVTWELNHLCLSHWPNRQADSNSLQLSGNGKDDPEIQRNEWQQHYKRMKDGEKNESDVRRGRCKMVLSLSCPSELLFSDSQSGIHWGCIHQRKPHFSLQRPLQSEDKTRHQV